MAAIDDRFRDAGDLTRGLALAVDDFREALPRGPQVVYPGEAEVFYRVPDQVSLGASFGLSRIEPALAHGVEERAQRNECRISRMFLIRQGFSFDSTESASIELNGVPRSGLLIL